MLVKITPVLIKVILNCSNLFKHYYNNFGWECYNNIGYIVVVWAWWRANIQIWSWWSKINEFFFFIVDILISFPRWMASFAYSFPFFPSTRLTNPQILSLYKWSGLRLLDEMIQQSIHSRILSIGRIQIRSIFGEQFSFTKLLASTGLWKIGC